MSKKDITAKVLQILDEHLEGKDLEVYSVDYRKEGPDMKLEVILDKPANSEDEYVSIVECEEATRYLSDKLDEVDIIDGSYMLEVGSPGLDRELIKESDFVRFQGRIVDVNLYAAIDGAKQLTGELVSADDDAVTIRDEGGNEIKIERSKVSKISLAVIF